MARKSRRQIEPKLSEAMIHAVESYRPKIQTKTAVYARLSVEKETDESIETQITMLHQYIAEHGEFDLVDTYVDEAVIIGLKPPSTNGRRFSPISITGHFPI